MSYKTQNETVQCAAKSLLFLSALLSAMLISACALAEDNYHHRLTVELEKPTGSNNRSSVIEVKQVLLRLGSKPAGRAIITAANSTRLEVI